jgi:hypothetical protein
MQDVLLLFHSAYGILLYGWSMAHTGSNEEETKMAQTKRTTQIPCEARQQASFSRMAKLDAVTTRQEIYEAKQTAILAQLEALTVMVQMHGERAAPREYPWDLIDDLHYIRTHLNVLLVGNAT